MVSDEQKKEIAQLRERGLPPKAIARQLSLRPSEVSAVLQEQAQASAQAVGRDTLPPLVACLVSRGWSCGLGLRDEALAWSDPEPDVGGTEGLVGILIARRQRYDKLTVAGYLVDTFCLGIKNALGPQTVEDDKFPQFAQRYFGAFHGAPVEAPLALAQCLVLGAEEYARALGFEPHSDYQAVRGLLGERPGPYPIRFGRDGRPVFVVGPDDNPVRIVATLRRTVGEGRFDVVSIHPR